MKKRIMLSIGVLAIAVVVSLNINLAKTDLSSLAFMNIQALAGETGGSESWDCMFKVSCKYTSECEDIFYLHIAQGWDIKQTVTVKETICLGEGSICCSSDFEIKTKNENVSCICR